MTKFYRLKKDCYTWTKGAILRQLNSGEAYRAVKDVWDVVEYEGEGAWMECAALIEKNPEWFERVYEVNEAEKTVYVSKEDAVKAANDAYESKVAV